MQNESQRRSKYGWCVNRKRSWRWTVKSTENEQISNCFNLFLPLLRHTLYTRTTDIHTKKNLSKSRATKSGEKSPTRHVRCITINWILDRPNVITPNDRTFAKMQNVRVCGRAKKRAKIMGSIIAVCLCETMERVVACFFQSSEQHPACSQEKWFSAKREGTEMSEPREDIPKSTLACTHMHSLLYIYWMERVLMNKIRARGCLLLFCLTFSQTHDFCAHLFGFI